MERHPMTEEQRRDLDQDLAGMMESLENITNLLRACNGETDMTVIRAEEAIGAVQRLVWAVQRRQAKQEYAAG